VGGGSTTFIKLGRVFKQCFGSGSELDPHSISFLDPDPDPGGVKFAKTKGKNGAKRQKIHHKKLT
jgi:hypothetical protein